MAQTNGTSAENTSATNYVDCEQACAKDFFGHDFVMLPDVYSVTMDHFYITVGSTYGLLIWDSMFKNKAVRLDPVGKSRRVVVKNGRGGSDFGESGGTSGISETGGRRAPEKNIFQKKVST